MRISRELQNQILKTLSEEYPNHISREAWKLLEKEAGDDDTLFANLLYLEEHKLLSSGISRGMNDFMINLSGLRITNRGIDFLLDDGGLGAILNVTTVKFHQDTVQQLADFIGKSNLSSGDKSKLLAQLKSLPADATKHIVMKLIDQGLSQMPNAIHWLQTVMLQG